MLSNLHQIPFRILLLLFGWILSFLCEEKSRVEGGSISGKVKPSCSNVLSHIFVASSVWRVWRSIGDVPNRTLWNCSIPSLYFPIITVQELCALLVPTVLTVYSPYLREKYYPRFQLDHWEIESWVSDSEPLSKKGCSNLKRFLSSSLHASSCITYPLLLLEGHCPL